MNEILLLAIAISVLSILITIGFTVATNRSMKRTEEILKEINR